MIAHTYMAVCSKDSISFNKWAKLECLVDLASYVDAATRTVMKEAIIVYVVDNKTHKDCLFAVRYAEI